MKRSGDKFWLGGHDHKRWLCAAFTVLALGGASRSAQAQAPYWSEPVRLLQSAPHSQSFGQSLSISGDTIVVGAASQDNGETLRLGAAYVYVRDGSGWVQEGPALSVPGGTWDDRFGQSVSISGDTLLVGAPLVVGASGSEEGAAMVFVRAAGVWTMQTTLTAPGPEQEFGSAVVIAGDTAVVGAASGGAGKGAVYVFTRSAGMWTQQARIVEPADEQDSYFGDGLALDADTLLIGAVDGTADTRSPGPGRVFVYVRQNGAWQQQGQPLTSEELGDAFGRKLALSGDTAVVSAPYALAERGAAYIFVRNGAKWALQRRLVGEVGSTSEFGEQVAVSGDDLVVSALQTPDSFAGPLFLYHRRGKAWSAVGKPLTVAPNVDDLTPVGLAMLGSTVAVGAYGIGADLGSAFAYEVCTTCCEAAGGCPSDDPSAEGGESGEGGTSGAAAAGTTSAVAGEGGVTIDNNAGGAPDSRAGSPPSAVTADDTASACGCRIVGNPAANARAGWLLALLALPCMLRRRSRAAIPKGQAKS